MSRCRYIKKLKIHSIKKIILYLRKESIVARKKDILRKERIENSNKLFFSFLHFISFILSLYLICEHKRQASKRAKNDVAKEITSISACHCLRYFADFISALLVTVFSFSSFFNSYFYFFSFPSCFH